MAGRGFILALALVLALPAASGDRAVAQEVIDREYELKVAFLYKVALYVEWPKNAVPGDDSTFVIGVVGPTPLAGVLKGLAGTPVKDKPIVIRQFASVKDYKPCHLLFVGGEADPNADEKTVADRVKAVVARTRGSPVLLVSDTDELAEKGMMVNLYIEGNRLKLAINLKAARNAGLTISASLLGLKGVVKIVG